MNADELRALQTPIKDRYRENPEAAVVRLHSRGELFVDRLTCRVHNVRGTMDAGLHPAAGGREPSACSGDILLDALVACAGVTISAVATSMGIAVRGGSIEASGEMDFRGTLGVNKETPIGLTKISLAFKLDTDAAPEQVEKLVKLTERYCVIYQTLKNPPQLVATIG